MPFGLSAAAGTGAAAAATKNAIKSFGSSLKKQFMDGFREGKKPATTIKGLTCATMGTPPPLPEEPAQAVLIDGPQNTKNHSWENPILIGVLLLLCFPFGLFLVWKHSSWTSKTKWIWTGAWAAAFMVFGMIGNRGEVSTSSSRTMSKNRNDVTDATVEEDKQDEEPLVSKKDSAPNSTSGMTVRKGPRKATDIANIELILKIKPGMTESQVIAILGQPHEIQENVFEAIPALNQPRRVLVTWTYNPKNKNWMGFLFSNGILQSGDSGGYDIRKGLIIPDNIKGILQKNKGR